MRKVIVAGNWKMNKTAKEAAEFFAEFKPLVADVKNAGIVIGVPFTALETATRETAGSNIKIAAENMNANDSGAYTGEVSPLMLKDLGVEYVILGHSERREIFKEDDSIINEKVKAGLNNGIKVVLCVGESEKTYNEGKTKEFVENQIVKALEGISKENISNEEDLIIAYEPIWAIGTGKVCSSDDADNMCRVIKDKVKEILDIDVPVLYGGSVNEQNSNEILLKENIDGVLVGGASLDPEKFAKIIYSGYKLGE